MERSVLIHPLDGPLSFLSDNVDICDGREEELFLLSIFDVGVDQERVGLGVDILHSNLEAIEASSFRYLNFRTELLCQIFEHDSI